MIEVYCKQIYSSSLWFVADTMEKHHVHVFYHRKTEFGKALQLRINGKSNWRHLTVSLQLQRDSSWASYGQGGNGLCCLPTAPGTHPVSQCSQGFAVLRVTEGLQKHCGLRNQCTQHLV